jgi:hypothetical protein
LRWRKKFSPPQSRSNQEQGSHPFLFFYQICRSPAPPTTTPFPFPPKPEAEEKPIPISFASLIFKPLNH